MIRNSDINCIRDEFGAIDLEHLPIKNLKYSDRDHATFYYNNIKYYLKRCSNIEKIYNELIAEELAHDYRIDCSYNDIAFDDQQYYFISADRRGVGDKYVSINEVLNLEDECNNLTDIWYALTLLYSDQIIVQHLMDQLVDIFLFDVLIANVDRHSDNYGIIQNDDKVSFHYLFDNEKMLNQISIYEGGYSIGIDHDDYFIFENTGIHFLEKFLSVSDSYYLEYFKEKFNIISKENIVSVFNRVETKIDCPIHPTIKKQIIKKLDDNCQVINRVLCKFNKRR